MTDRSVAAGQSTGAIPFTVGDAETPAGSLVVSAASSNTTLVPTSAIVLGGSGSSRTVSVTPAAGQSGMATITLMVADAGGLTATDTFVLTVTVPPPSPPPPPATGNGLKVTYYDNIDFTGATVTRVEATVDHNWKRGSPVAGIGPDTFSAVWTGQVQAVESGTYTFRTYSDEGVRVWVNGQLIINNWTDHTATYNTGTITLVAGQKYDIRVEYYDRTGTAVMKLQWKRPGQTGYEVIPQSQLYSGV